MSAIDCNEHSFIGMFCGIPTYHPIEDGEVDDFSFTAKNILIGGGSGEHPSMKVINLDRCVMEYLDTFMATPDHFTPKYPFYDEFDEEFHKEYGYDWCNLEYDWSMQDVTDFSKRVNKQFKIYYKYHDIEKKSFSVEKKISIMLGEWLFFSGRSILSEKLNDFLIKHDEDLMYNATDMFQAMTIVPRGYRVYGKYTQYNKDGTFGKSIWGFRFEDESIVVKQLD